MTIRQGKKHEQGVHLKTIDFFPCSAGVQVIIAFVVKAYTSSASSYRQKKKNPNTKTAILGRVATDNIDNISLSKGTAKPTSPKLRALAANA